VEESADLTPGFERGRARLEAMFSAGSGPMLSPEAPREDEAPAEPLPLARREPRPPKNDRRLLALSTAPAACLLIAVGVQAYRQKSATSAGEAVAWGWAKPGGIPAANTARAEYLNGLALSAEEWFNEKPEDAAALARRINELRTGCSKLIFSPHEPLPEKDREWLGGDCREGGEKRDDHLTALADGAVLTAARAD